MTDNIDDTSIVGIDIGSSKVVAVIGETLPDGVIKVLGTGVSPSKGVDRGGVIDLDAVIRSVNNAIEDAEIMANLEVSKVMLAISGEYITGLNEMGMIPVDAKIKKEDVEQATHTASSVRLPDGLEMLHIIPQEFKVDRLISTKNPIGLSGNRLTAQVHLIATHQDWKRNLINAVEQPDRPYEVARVVFSGLASSYSVLKEEDKELGVCVIDIGAGTVDVIVYVAGALRFSKSYPFGGNDVTDYIANTFFTTRKEAEQIKINYGSAVSPPTSNPDKKFSIAGLSGGAPRIYTKSHVSELTARCYREMFEVINADLAKLRYDLYQNGIKQELIAGFMLTGGGSQIEDIVKCAKNVFDANVRLGTPLYIAGLTDTVNKPQYATVLGLLQYNFHYPVQKNTIINNPMGDTLDGLKKVTLKAVNWIKSNF